MPNNIYNPVIEGFDNLAAAVVSGRRSRRQERDQQSQEESRRKDRALDREVGERDRRDRLDLAVQAQENRVAELEEARNERKARATAKTEDAFIQPNVMDEVNKRWERAAVEKGYLIPSVMSGVSPRIAPGKEKEFNELGDAAYGEVGYDRKTLKQKQALQIPGPFTVHAPAPKAADPRIIPSQPSPVGPPQPAQPIGLDAIGNPPYMNAPELLPPEVEQPIPRSVIPPPAGPMDLHTRRGAPVTKPSAPAPTAAPIGSSARPGLDPGFAQGAGGWSVMAPYGIGSRPADAPVQPSPAAERVAAPPAPEVLDRWEFLGRQDPQKLISLLRELKDRNLADYKAADKALRDRAAAATKTRGE